MGGTQLALPRWAEHPDVYRDRVFVGSVLDIGGSGDSIALARNVLSKITDVSILDHNQPPGPSVAEWIQADANTFRSERQWDVVYSSHCLEHLRDPEGAVARWWEMVRPGGWLAIIVPSWHRYERERWPSRFNSDHKSAWVRDVREGGPYPTHVRGLLQVVGELGGSFVWTLDLDRGFDPSTDQDQTSMGTCECGIEALVWKHVWKAA